MAYKFEIPETILHLRSKLDNPWDVGVAVGRMLHHIQVLLTIHLDNNVDFRNSTPEALKWAVDFTSALDNYIAHLRILDGLSAKVPDDGEQYCRKTRLRRRKIMKRYLSKIEEAYKTHIREALADVFQVWSGQQTRLFNKGIDKALSGIQWVVYPDRNVVLHAGEEDWSAWLRGICEESALAEHKAGRPMFKDD